MTTADFTPCPRCPTQDACAMARRCLERRAAKAAPIHPRAAVLREAERLICGPREADYGPPAVNFQRIADMWAAYLGHPVTAAQVCDCMALLKMARLGHQPGHEDSRKDAAAYVALGWEVVEK